MTTDKPPPAPAPTRPLPPAERALDQALDELGARRAPEPPSEGMDVAEVLDDRHPALVGRVKALVAGQPPRWLPTLRGLAVRQGDRVLITQPRGITEPVVVGVLDGYRPRPTVATQARPLALRSDEVVSIQTNDGRPLFDLYASDAGPVLRLATDDLTLDVPGALRVLADRLELRARDGGATIAARDDVEIRGEVIHLN